MEASKDKKIFVLGAGLGGVFAAYKLSKAGFNVTVYEKKAKSELGYPWHDSVKPNTFSDVKLNIPEKALIKKQRLNFYCLESNNFVKQGSKTEKSFDVDRKMLIDYLLSLAESYCKVNYSTAPDSLLVENEKVCGIILNGKKLYADLVIDSSGCQSPFRKDVPEKFMIESEISPNDYMESFRGFYVKKSTASNKKVSNV